MAAPSLTPSRVVAHEVMRDLRRGELLDRALERGARRLDARDLAWTRELLYGTQRLRGRIDHLLSARVRGGMDSLEPDVLDVLRLGAYQLLEMGGVPTYAAISQSVDLVRAAGAPRAAGLVNGVLRALDRERARPRFPDPAAEPVEYLCSWGSHPRWLVERWLARWGYEETERLLASNNERPELYVRPIGVDVDQAGRRLGEAGIESERVDLAPRSLRISSDADVAAILAAAPLVVQDPAAGLVTDYAAAPAGATVLDLCAAPGGKAAGMSEAARYVVAGDISEGRLRRVRQNVARLGLEGRVGAVVADGRVPPYAEVDLVLLDAPCTGTGTFRRHPDGRWRIGPAELAALIELQRELLESAARLVRPGGVLVYATCSLEPEENAEQMAAFLARHPEFEPAPADRAVDPALLAPDGSLLVLPQRHQVDGAYALRMRRRE